MEEVIPSNYTHVFLVRNPVRTMPSLYNVVPKVSSGNFFFYFRNI